MNFPEWTKPGVSGAVIGAVVVSVLGFSWGGWTTAGTAQEMAQSHAEEELVLAMVPVCLNAAATDPDRDEKLATILDASSSFNRRSAMMATGWATFPGSENPNRDLAVACVEGLELVGS